MTPLDKDLQRPKTTLEEFYDVTLRVMDHMKNVLSASVDKNDYTIFVSESAGAKKYLRPINKKLYIDDKSAFEQARDQFLVSVAKIRNRETCFSPEEKANIDSFLYTIQQSVGAGLDLLVHPNSSRKHVGNRFEELIRVLFSMIGISNKRVVLKIPYDCEGGKKDYKCENDLIVSPYDKVKSTHRHLDENEIVVSVKTSSKDRMGKMFLDKILLERFVGHPQKVIGIFNNDVQRKEHDNISFTLVSNLFMVYRQFVTELEGIYYLDPPPATKTKPYSNHMKTVSELVTSDIFELLHS